MKQLLSFGFLSLWLLCSCASQRAGQIYHQVPNNEVQSAIINDSLFEIELAYIGAIGHSYIFECTIVNHSEVVRKVDHSMFQMDVGQRTLHTIDEDHLVEQLVVDRRELRKDKKTTTILSGIIVGVAAIAGVSSGASVGEILLYNTEPIFGIFDERRWYQRNIESVEDEIEYVRSAQFKNTPIQPNQDIVRDVLFPTIRIKNDVELVFNYKGIEYIFFFPRKVFR